jgi:hypothetical protein
VSGVDRLEDGLYEDDCDETHHRSRRTTTVIATSENKSDRREDYSDADLRSTLYFDVHDYRPLIKALDLRKRQRMMLAANGS